jgi:hypothetical protein
MTWASGMICLLALVSDSPQLLQLHLEAAHTIKSIGKSHSSRQRLFHLYQSCTAQSLSLSRLVADAEAAISVVEALTLILEKPH